MIRPPSTSPLASPHQCPLCGGTSGFRFHVKVDMAGDIPTQKVQVTIPGTA